jgi:hypothetical protein
MTASDASQIVRSCRGCHYFMSQIHYLTQELKTIPIIWPFAVWGLYLLEPFKKVPGSLTDLLIKIEKFTNWIEVMALANIGSKQAMNFIQDIIFYFVVSSSIIIDNDTQFTRENSLISMMISEWTRPWSHTHERAGRSSMLTTEYYRA